MQHLWIELLDASGQVVAVTGYTDNWVAHRGGTFSQIGSSATGAIQNALALSGTATIAINRSGGVLQTRWNGAVHRSDFNSTPVAKLRLVFERYPYSCSGQHRDVQRPRGRFCHAHHVLARDHHRRGDAAVAELLPLAHRLIAARIQTFASGYGVQWRRNGVPVNLADPRISVTHGIPGPSFNAFTERLTITNLAPGDQGTYTLEQLCGTATSAAAGTLTVLPTCPEPPSRRESSWAPASRRHSTPDTSLSA